MHHNRKERKKKARDRRAMKKVRRGRRAENKATCSGLWKPQLLPAVEAPPPQPLEVIEPLANDENDGLPWPELNEFPVKNQAPEPKPVQENPMPENNQVVDEANKVIVKANKKQPPVDNAANEITREVAAVQLAVQDGVDRQCKDSAHEMAVYDDSVIKQVRERPLADLIPAFGEFMATKLKYFCDEVDLGHPIMQNLLRLGFQADSEFNSTLREIMTLLSLEQGSSMTKVLALLKESFTKAKSMKEVRLAIYKPPTRSLRTQAARDLVRSKKLPKDVGLKEWLEKAKHWNDHPGSFLQFSRLNDSYNETFAQNEKKAARMEELMMTGLAGAFRKRNEIIKNFLGEQYCGFTKLKMLDAAIVLAKVHGANFKEDYRSVSYPRKVFAKTPFWLEPESTYKAINKSPDADPNRDHKVTVQACMIPDIFLFRPRAYPLHEFKVEMPDHVKGIIAAVEDHPDMLSKALFDQFWVIVPGVGLAPEMHNYSGKWVIRVGDICELHPSAESAEKSLDVHLVKSGSLHPAVLGEKDGKCFFLTYFSVPQDEEE